VEVPKATEKGYAGAIGAEIARHEYLTVLPTSDAALLALGAPVRHLVDKLLLAQGAEKVGLRIPPGKVLSSSEELARVADRLEYPVVVKPSISYSPPFRADSPSELARRVPAGVPIVVQPYIDEALHAVAGVAWQGEFVATVHQRYLRTWPVDCGTSCAAETVAPDLDLERRLLDLLAGYDGIFQVQMAGEHLLDANPRPYGSLPLAIASGANLVAIYCDLLRGVSVSGVRAREGVFYRWLEGDMRHLWFQFRKGHLRPLAALQELRPHRHAAHSVESWRDPLPMFLRARFAATGRT
jgi:predicted ATP-grasp superfamily ATP-dependent carboligase